MKRKEETGKLIAVDVALESMRDSGYDLSTAIGEVVDNSIEAKARTIKIHTGFVKGATKEIREIAIADDGVGISPEFLQHTLTLGYSTRYNQRTSLGRFGMGLKVAGISQARRIEIYTRQTGGPIYYTYIDLEEIRSHQQTCIEKWQVESYPLQYQQLMSDEKGKEYPSGTLVIWSKIDRLVNQGRYASSLDKKMGDLLDFLARAYRYFLDQGIRIILDGSNIYPYDPLFLIENPRLTEKAGGDHRAEIIDRKELTIDGQKVEFTVTLLPALLRKRRGDGGFRGKAKQFDFLHLEDNAGKISIVRNGREIYYHILPKALPGGKDDLDRFIGIEIKFPAQLDEYFQVRNVKRGAEPVDNLREEFRRFVQQPVKKARKEIRKYWVQSEAETDTKNNTFQQAMDIVAKADQTAPGGRAGMNRNQADILRILNTALQDIKVDPQENPRLAEEKRQEFLTNPVSLLSSQWPGKELFEIDHVNGKSIVKWNARHPFFHDIYCQLRKVKEDEDSEWSKQALVELVCSAKVAVELLIMAYAKAESLHPDADEVYSSLRSYWGIFLGEYMNGLTNDTRM